MKISLIISQVIFILLFPVWLELTKYLHWIVIAVVWFCYSFLVVFVVCLVNQVTISFNKRLLSIVTAAYSASLLILLLLRPNDDHGSSNLVPFETISFYLSGKVDFLIAFYNLGANIALFIPFGLYYKYVNRKPSPWRILIYTLLCISLIEITQFVTHRGSLDIDDLILNTAGVFTGFVLYPLFQKVFKMIE
ncbi:VanZ family protein [Bacillus salacetis]|uniref:VanZ family protein n=1 Tax=Bacillus salacetis TaxID=2315464 RepID=UPI003BA0C816